MRKIFCSLLIASQLVACARVDTPPERRSGDTTHMEFESDDNGNVQVMNFPDDPADKSDANSNDNSGASEVGADGPESDQGAGGSGGGGGGVNLDVSGFFKGIGELAGQLGGLVQAGVGAITGENKRKKKEAERKAKEIEGLLTEVEGLKGEIGKRAKELEDSTNGTASKEFSGENDTQDAINRRGQDHNRDVENTRNRLPGLGKKPENTPGNDSPDRDPYPTPEKEKVRKTRDFLGAARKNVQESFTGNERKARERILDSADGATDSAEESYRSGNTREGDWKLEIARKAADLVVSSTPIAGEIYDIFNAINGQNVITGEPIPPEEGVIQAANAIYSLATGGSWGIIKDAAKASKVLKEIATTVAKNAAKKAGKEALDPKTEHAIEKQHRDALDDLHSQDKTEHDIHANTDKGKNPLPADQKYSYDPKIEKQMEKRGWNDKSLEDTMRNPDRTVPTRDTRNNPKTGQKNDDPATAYIDKDGNYVVRNDRTGEIVQVSDKNDPNWISPFGR